MSKNDLQLQSLEYTREQVWQIYREIGESERHFNKLQERYRLISSSWLLATTAAAAYLIANQTEFASVPVAIEVVIACLAYFGSIGISLLWILDVKVYQVLLSSYYAEGLALERGQAWLPPVRRRIRSKFKGKLPVLIATFYIGCTSFLLLLGTLAFVLFVYLHWQTGDILRLDAGIALALGVFNFSVVVLMYAKSFQSGIALEEDEKEFSEEMRTKCYEQAVIRGTENATKRTNPEVETTCPDDSE